VVATQLRRITIVLSISAVIGYLGVFWLPVVVSARLTGISGKSAGDGFLINAVTSSSAGSQAGLKTGDSISAFGGRTISEWTRLYKHDHAEYLRAESALARSEIVPVEYLRENRLAQTDVRTRTLGLGEFFLYYGVHLLIALFFALPALYIVLARARDPNALLMAACFSAAVLWAISDRPLWLWPGLLPPLIFDHSTFSAVAVTVMDLLANSLMVSMLVHLSLVFPERSPLLNRHPWLLWVNYALPMMVMGTDVMVRGAGMQAILPLYRHRLWLTSTQLIVTCALLLKSFYTTRSPMQRERTRWVVAATVFVLLWHLLFWNVPLILTGDPLISRYDWMLLPVVAIPLSLTLAINTHHLFGIRVIVRRRLRVLQRLLDHERGFAVNRDRHIHELTREIGQLRQELEEYTRAEAPIQTTIKEGLPVLQRLEEQYPEIRKLREERLVSASPKWEGVFADAALAARGAAPVLIIGESGTGKTDIAWLIQRLGERREAAYKQISCAQFEHTDPAIALGRLFGIGPGHGLPNIPREGQRGLLEECDGGTLFLDDFDRLPLNVQDAFLYPLEGKPFDPGIGSGPARAVSIKFIFASNRDLDALLAERALRGDVLARMGTRVVLPPLRERPEDIPPLVEYFVRQACADLKHEVSTVSPKAMNLLARYPYRAGNARELKAELYRAVGNAMLEQDPVLRAGYLSEVLQGGASAKEETPPPRERKPPPAAEPVPATRAMAPTRAAGGPAELQVLRRHRFALRPSEAELGFSQKSRTLSHHLRGICLQALTEHEWRIEDAARGVVGADDTHLIGLLAGKMRRYLENIRENLAAGTPDKLYQNLPLGYHRALERAIDRMRSAGTAAGSGG
jgi:DNA-binding NtrC family response regulator